MPLNSKTQVRIEAVGKEVAIFFNNSIVHLSAQQGVRISGNATVMMSSPWYPAAIANISSITLTSISSITGSGQSLSDFSGPISKGSLIGKTFVPADYALTFDITPTGFVPNDWSNIIHFTQDYSDSGPKGRIPCMLL